MNLYKTILNILFPIRCISCNKKYTKYLCLECLEKIPFQNNTNDPFIFSAFSYKNTIVKKALWELKFYGKQEIATGLSEKAYEILLDELQDKNMFNDFENPVLVPIPLHKKRYRERGFNQAELISKVLYKKNPSLFSLDAQNLIRTKYTKPQAKISQKNERLSNISDCFEVTKSHNFHNKNIILIDDITTTGATINEAKKILKKAGARNVYGFTLAQ